jgi:hypothetical protein
MSTEKFDDSDLDFDGNEVAIVVAPDPAQALIDEKLIDWERKGRELAKQETDVRWQIGDWMLEGVKLLGDIPGDPFNTTAIAESLTGLSGNTLRDLSSTAYRVKPSVRTDELSWSHHRVLINAKPDADEEELKEHLDRAIKERLSVAAFAKSLKSPVGPPPTLEKSILVTVPLFIWEHLTDRVEDPEEDDPDDLTIQTLAARAIINFVQSEEEVVKRERARARTKERRHAQRVRAGKRSQKSYPRRLNN